MITSLEWLHLCKTTSIIKENRSHLGTVVPLFHFLTKQAQMEPSGVKLTSFKYLLSFPPSVVDIKTEPWHWVSLPLLFTYHFHPAPLWYESLATNKQFTNSGSVLPARIKMLSFMKTSAFAVDILSLLWAYKQPERESGLALEQLTLSHTDTRVVYTGHAVSWLGDSLSFLVWLRRPKALDPQQVFVSLQLSYLLGGGDLWT